MKLANPSVLITGGAKRIGLELARRSVVLGYDVVIHYRTEKSAAIRWLNAEPALKKRVALLYKKDLGSDPSSLIESALSIAPKLTGLVNNASVFLPGNLLDGPSFDRQLHINTLVPLELSRSFACRVSSGWIINMTDANIQAVNTGYQNYRISKLILSELTRQLAVLLGPRIRVNAIAPGAVLPASGEKPAMLAKLRKSAPMNNGGTVNDVLNAYDYLLNSSGITGQTLYADGGLHLR